MILTQYYLFYRIVSVDISPEWPEKRTILTGSADGAVKQWNLEPLLQSNIVKLMLSHDIHRNDREVRISYILVCGRIIKLFDSDYLICK